MASDSMYEPGPGEASAGQSDCHTAGDDHALREPRSGSFILFQNLLVVSELGLDGRLDIGNSFQSEVLRSIARGDRLELWVDTDLIGFGLVAGVPLAGAAIILGLVSGSCTDVAHAAVGGQNLEARTNHVRSREVRCRPSSTSSKLQKIRQLKADIRAKPVVATQEAQAPLGEIPAEIEKRIRGELLNTRAHYKRGAP